MLPTIRVAESFEGTGIALVPTLVINRVCGAQPTAPQHNATINRLFSFIVWVPLVSAELLVEQPVCPRERLLRARAFWAADTKFSGRCDDTLVSGPKRPQPLPPRRLAPAGQVDPRRAAACARRGSDRF